MKSLQTYLIETIKPPRLSTKNKELWKGATESAIMKWLKENCWIKGKVEIVNGKINVKGDIYIVNKSIEYFPYPFGKVNGDFSCTDTKIATLKNCPEYVGGDFYCIDCYNLTSLEGAPKEVGGNFYLKCVCGIPAKKFTEEDVKKVCNVKGKICASH